MDFKNWFINETIQFSTWLKDGTIMVYIDGKKYVYITDPIYHSQIKKLAKFKPFSALNLIKSMIKDNVARQIE